MSTITRVPYMYRDASNYKAFHHVDLWGEFPDEQREQVRATLASINDNHDSFIPAQIGWEHAAVADPTFTTDAFPKYDDDHCWHELDVDEIKTVHTVEYPPTQTTQEWVDKMVAAGEAGWDDATYGIEA